MEMKLHLFYKIGNVCMKILKLSRLLAQILLDISFGKSARFYQILSESGDLKTVQIVYRQLCSKMFRNREKTQMIKNSRLAIYSMISIVQILIWNEKYLTSSVFETFQNFTSNKHGTLIDEIS